MHGKVRSLAAIVVFTSMIFSGCSNSGSRILEKTPDINTPFGSSVKMQAGELEFEGTVKRHAAGIWDMNITSPETLEGFCISYDEATGVKAVLDELTMDVPMESLNENAAFALVFKAIDCAAAAGELKCTSTEEGKIYSGEFSGGTYTLTFDPEGNVLTGIEIPSAGIAGEFIGFEKTKPQPASPEGTTTVISEEETEIIED